MRNAIKGTIVSLLILGQASWVLADANDAFQFFQEEAKVVTVSHQPQRRDHASATVYVVTSDEIKDSGATNIWDALRTVPGLDVMYARTADGNVSVRGMDQPFNTRTLILVDGRKAAHSFNDFTNFETLPITLDEIDRIEVVEGPGSAVYGPNAINGVINIITKTPQQLQGGIVSYTGGQRQTHIVNAAYGHEGETMKYKFGGGWNQTNSLQDDNDLALRTGKWNGLVGLKLNPDSELDFSGGVTQLRGDFSAGTASLANTVGTYFYTRADYRYKDTKFFSYWNGERSTIDVSAISPHETFNADRYYNSLSQTFHLPWKNEAVLGGEYSHLHADVNVYESGQRTRDLWAFFGEDHWDITDQLALMGNARVDHYPLTPNVFSSLGSLIYTPINDQTFRVSAGQSFRNPDRGENNLDTSVSFANAGQVDPALTNPPFSTVNVALLGKRDLSPERMREEEVAYRGRFGNAKTALTGFHYILKDLIAAGPTDLAASPFVTIPNIELASIFVNAGQIEAWGGEAGVDYLINPNLTSFANYSMQDVTGNSPTARILAAQSPRHKANAGLRYKKSGYTGSLWSNWVDSTHWGNYNTTNADVNAYFLINAHVGYAFSGRWQGLEIGVNAFNLANNRHYEFARTDTTDPASQFGQVIGNRWTGTASYRF